MFEAYTCHSAATFDPVMRRWDAKALQLFRLCVQSLAPGATFENIEFDTQCSNNNGTHGRHCDIRLVTVRRRSNGPNGHDVVACPPSWIPRHIMDTVARAHLEAYPS